MRPTALAFRALIPVLSVPRSPRRPSFLRQPWQLAAVCLGICLAPAQALAFQTGSPATEGCHEKLTTRAWKAAKAALPETTATLPSRGEDEALMADVVFKVPKSMQHIGGVTLLLGVRDNDVKEHGPTDLKSLAPAASDPKGQQEHCLRAPEQDGPTGSAEAVESCRNYIRETLLSAVDALDEQGMPDNLNRETLKVSLAIREEIDVKVPAFFLRAGRGLHALQDSFTHTFRRPNDPGKITVVLNWVEYVDGTLNEAVDGPPHAAELDVCDDPDELRTERRMLAQEASGVALLAMLDPALSRSDKEEAIDAMLDQYVTYDETADCSVENNWCDAPEVQYGSPTLGCSFGGALPPSGGWALLPLAGALALLRARRRRSLVTGATLVAALLLGQTGVARADDKQGPIDSPTSALSGTSDSATVGKIDRAGAFFGRLAIGASFDNAAFSGGVGVRYQLSRNWMLGLDGEWNPYVAISPRNMRSGSANAYFSIIRRFQLRWQSVNIRTTASVGGSMLLFDLVGAEKYNMGPFFGVSFLGAEWKAARGFYVTIDPTYIAIPIPSVTGVPFMYAQYRFLVGIEFGG